VASAAGIAHRDFQTRGATILHFSVHSRDVGRTLEQTAVEPRGGGRRPLLVLLHWRGGSPDRLLSNELFAALAQLDSRAPAVVMPNGSGGSFFHDRHSGRWASYVVDEVIPAAVRRLRADPARIAIGGTSMGGFGALDIARLHPGRFCAVGAHSPAIFTSARGAMAGAFDGPADFARHDLHRLALSTPRPYANTPVWIDVGTRDRFRGADEATAAALRARGARLSQHVWPGEHGSAYWRAHIADYLRFYADELARCRPGRSRTTTRR
jgi:S-formylglutathione hydrolase FrmB